MRAASLVQDYPSSVRASLTKKGEQRYRRLLPRHLDTCMFSWLAVSRVPGKEGAYCIPCVLSTCATGVGGRSEGHGQFPGKLVTAPLDRFDDLTGKDGALSRHELTNRSSLTSRAAWTQLTKKKSGRTDR